MKNVLLYYSFGFSLGGGEYLPLSFISTLQKLCNLTVAVDVADNLERSYRAFGAGLDIDLAKLRIVQVTPPGYDPLRHNAIASLHRARRLKALAEEADVCISAANIMDFGKSAHHFINMVAFGDDAFADYAHDHDGGSHVGAMAGPKQFLEESIVRPLLGLRSKRSIICDKSQQVYPNSRYVERLMEGFYGKFNSHVFYPPTLFRAEPAAAERDPLKVVYIGRIVPGKRIEELVDIVERVRAATGIDVTFHLAGRLDQTPAYGRKLGRMAAERDWLRFVGELYGDEKTRFLTSGSYAIHAERDEAFGISVAEYLLSGLIPLVPDEGGTPEIVDSPSLTYHTDDDAAQILARLLADAGFRQGQARHCSERAKLFTREAYFERQRELLHRIVDSET
jgi:glycosyltransferase involved in cell wall biosynthesis